jgi:hypothetical protein
MDELQLLIGMVSNLPAMALWVLTGFFAYKVVVVGSIYGVIRFVGGRLFDWLQEKKAREVEYKEIRPMLDGMCIRAEIDRLIAQIHRLRGRGVNISSEYIHTQSVDWLRDAIDKKIESEAAAGVRKAA